MVTFSRQLLGLHTNDALLEVWKETYASLQIGRSETNKSSIDDENASGSNTDTAVTIAAPKSEAEAIEILKKAGDPSGRLSNKSEVTKSTTGSSNNNSSSVVMPIRVLQAIQIVSEKKSSFFVRDCRNKMDKADEI